MHRWQPFALAAGLFAACTIGGHAQQAATAAVPALSEDTWLEGSVDGAPVRMYIGPAGWPLKEGLLWGAYFYTRVGTLIPLEGHREPSGAIVLYEGDPSAPHDEQPRFELTFAAGTAVSGTWTRADTQRTVRVRLKRVPQPAPFEKAIARPRTFDSPEWPFTFTYPDGWSLRYSDASLVLQSPDPFDLLFDNRLECSRGEGLPARPAAGEPATEFRGGFFLGHDGWLAPSDESPNPSCDQPESKCAAPPARSAGSARFMRTTTGYRSYNPWGYAGLAEARSYLVIDGSQWVHCVDRLLDSPDRIAVKASKTGKRPR